VTTSLPEKLINRLATLGGRPSSRRGFLAGATLAGAALAIDPWGYLTRPQDAYASVCGPDSSCGSGYSAMCCSINKGHNTCPPHSYPGGWWKADRSSYCGGAARYYIDCNAEPGYHFTCHCNESNCDHRYVACNIFRYGQCNTHVHGITAVVCRQISCLPPWLLHPGECGKSSATDNNTAEHNAPCLTKANTYPNLVTFPKAHDTLASGKSLGSGERLTSYNRHTELLMQSDGNLTLRNENGVTWQTHTSTTAAGGSALLRRSGELVVRDRTGVVRWSSRSTTVGAPTLILHDSGELAIVHGTHTYWHTDTRTP
jgi:hypothetical protein